MTAPLPRCLAAILAGGLLLSASCRFERRPEPENGSLVLSSDTVERVTRGPVRDSVRAVVRAWHEALAVGDGSRVASLSVPGATVVDQEENVSWRLGPGAQAGTRLPRPLSSASAGLGWNLASTDFVAWDGVAMLVDRYRATVSGEPVAWTAVETFILERSPDGWRLRHVHRSRGGPADGGVRPEPRPDAEL